MYAIRSYYDLGDPANMEVNHHIVQALRANALFVRDKDYVVQDGEVLIVDEFTGRLMIGRRYSEGLHQALEAKEGVITSYSIHYTKLYDAGRLRGSVRATEARNLSPGERRP